MIYLDNAATSFPKPKRVYERMDQFLRREAANPGRSGHRLSVQAESQIVRARAVLAKLFGAHKPERIIFTLNCTDSLNIAIKGCLKEGDHAITTVLEHNSVLRPLHALEAAGKISLTKLSPAPDGFIDPSDVKKAIQKNTKLVVLTHASNVVGVLQPVREIGKVVREAGAGSERPPLFLVDAAQTAGVVSIDVEADYIDLLAFPGHKSLYGPPGTGGLYVGERAALFPWREGGTGFDSESPVQPLEFPFVLEGGTPNSVGIVGLAEGIQFLLEEGLDRIRTREQNLIRRLRSGLAGIPELKLFGSEDPDCAAAPVSFTLSRIEPQELSILLDQSFDIASRAGLHCAPLMHKTLGTFPQGTVRLSPGYFNTENEIDCVIAAIREIKGQLG